MELHYLLPLKTRLDTDVSELAQYLRELAALVDVIVVDGSDDAAFARNCAAFGGAVTHVAPDVGFSCANGKVAGVLTGMRRCAGEKVVIADDDVRYTRAQLQRVERALDTAELVRPQNYFAQLLWHARLDTGRTLLNRLFRADYPGTLGIRVTPELVKHGYDGDVLFENLELIRTVKALGGRESVLRDLLVARQAPDTTHFWLQRVRQAYDSWGQPARLAAELAILPVVVASVARSPRRGRAAARWAAGIVSAAEIGRRRAGGAAVFPRSAALWAPAWVVERGCCAWAAAWLRISGRGVTYNGRRIVRAAHSQRALARAAAAS